MTILKLRTLVMPIPLASIYLSTILITDLLFIQLLFLCDITEVYGGLFQTTLLSQIPLILKGAHFFINQFSIFLSPISSFQDGLLATALIVYSNADIDKTQVLIDNKDKAGVYQWTHIESGKIYVGSSNNLHRRLRNYYTINFLTRTKNNGMIISKALLKHGYAAFSLTILEHIDISKLDSISAKNLILEKEQHYLDLLNPEFNILKKAGNSLGYKHTKENLIKLGMPKTDTHIKNISLAKTGTTHTEETKVNMGLTRKGTNNPFYGKAHSEESRTKISLARKGFTHTEEAKAKIGLAKKGIYHPFYGKTHTPETLIKISLAKNKKVFVYSTFSNEIILFKSFENYTETAKYFNCSKRTLSDYVDKNKLYKKKWLLFSNPFNKE